MSGSMHRPTYRAHQRMPFGLWRARYVMALDVALLEDRVLSLVQRLRP